MFLNSLYSNCKEKENGFHLQFYFHLHLCIHVLLCVFFSTIIRAVSTRSGRVSHMNCAITDLSFRLRFIKHTLEFCNSF